MKLHDEIIKSHVDLVENNIMSFVPKADSAYKIIEDAMKYSLESGGKRVRPVLTLEFSRILGGDLNKTLPFAAAVEFVHTYSLIHDDLPCMDNDDYRRGKLSSHKKFNEAAALLAGDALLTHAFSALASSELDGDSVKEAVLTLSSLAGVRGMIGGQVIDMEGEKRDLSKEELFLMDKMKTAALIKAACRLGVIASGRMEYIDAADSFGENLGLAFQIIDDILDYLEGDQSSDIVLGKTTYVSLLGIKESRAKASEYTEKSLSSLESIDKDVSVLKAFALKLLKRET